MLLAVETSCDETAVALFSGDGGLVHQKVATQVELHARHGGIVPELASRAHCEALSPLVTSTLAESSHDFGDLHRVAVTVAPGLIGPLLVGVEYARGLGFALEIPVIGIHHLEGHIFAPWVDGGEPPARFIALVVSGGHTDLYLVEGAGQYKRIGVTRDDAAGEAFDKVARILGLGYPGGPVIDRLAANGNPKRWRFPRPMENKGLDFSFSGLKSAVSRHVDDVGVPENEDDMADLCASIQDAIVSVLVSKAIAAVEHVGCEHLVITGGVAANSCLRSYAQQRCDDEGIKLVIPERRHCTDNAAMIGRAALFLERAGIATLDVDAHASLRLDRARQ